MGTDGRRDSGQALPIYITAVAGLLFLAFAYFVVGQAAASRNGAQSAADAAALAAAQEARDRTHRALLASVRDPEDWDDLLDGDLLGGHSSCLRAQRFAAENGADVVPGGCRRLTDGRVGFTVEVRTQQSLGRTVVPGTEDTHMTATATAVIEPRCAFDPGAEGPKGGGDSDDGRGDDKPAFPGTLTCDGEGRLVDPEDPVTFPDAADLFTVRLSD